MSIEQNAKRATKAQMEAAIKKIGATRDTDSEANTIIVDAPDGFVFTATGDASMTTTCVDDGRSFMPEAYADMIERLSYGLQPEQ